MLRTTLSYRLSGWAAGCGDGRDAVGLHGDRCGRGAGRDGIDYIRTRFDRSVKPPFFQCTMW